MKTGIIFITALFILFGSTSCSNERSKPPILVLANNTGFGTYTAEILKAEGFNEYILDSLYSKKLTASYLRGFDFIILSECRLDRESKSLLEKYVNSGGNLISFRPDTAISGIFGIKPETGKIREGYIRIAPESDQGKGLSKQKMQFHGTADQYTVNTASTIAFLYADKSSEDSFPAVVSHDYGEGHAIAFLYNLPKSIVYTRQGNPLSAGIEKDGIPGLRGMDLFTDGWVDTAANTINQADQQMALLTNCIQNLTQYTQPLPRFWYFPDTLKCLAVLDNDGENNNEFDFEPQFRDIDSMGAKMTIYIKDVDKVSKEWVAKWTAKGFEIAAHPDDTRNAGNPSWKDMDSALTAKISDINSKFNLSVRTNVNHWFVWCGKDEDGKQNFAAQALLEEKHGIEMNANYALYDINSNQAEYYLGTPGTNQGNYTGSGMVMKYADASGKTVNVYQRYNAVYDQQYNEGRGADAFFECFKGLVDKSLNDDIYSVVSIKAHNNEYYFSKEPLLKMLAYANSKEVPVWTAVNLLEFLKMKDEASFSNLSWVNNQLTFTLNSSLEHSHSLSFIVPATYNGKVVKRIIKDGQHTPFSIKRIKGFDYAFVTVRGGRSYEISVEYI